MKAHAIAFILTVIGGINWGLVGIGGFTGSDWNVIHWILGFSPQLEWVVYILVGVSAVYLLSTHKKDCKYCSTGMGM